MSYQNKTLDSFWIPEYDEAIAFRRLASAHEARKDKHSGSPTATAVAPADAAPGSGNQPFTPVGKYASRRAFAGAEPCCPGQSLSTSEQQPNYHTVGRRRPVPQRCGERQFSVLLGTRQSQHRDGEGPVQSSESEPNQRGQYCSDWIWAHRALHRGAEKIHSVCRCAGTGFCDSTVFVEEIAESPGILLPLRASGNGRANVRLRSILG